jgi:hypothetical protein
MDRETVAPLIAAMYIGLLVLAVVVVGMPPSAAVSSTSAMAVIPKLSVVTIAEDDEVREKGMMVMCLPPPGGWDPTTGAGDWGPWNNIVDANTCKSVGWSDTDHPEGVLPDRFEPQNEVAPEAVYWEDKWASYKIIVTYGGQLLDPSILSADCEIIQKDTVEPKLPQFPEEQLKRVVTDVTSQFACKFRWLPNESVGVLDVYLTGTQTSEMIAPYIVVVDVWATVGTTEVYGTEMQDLCVLGFPWSGFDTDWQTYATPFRKPENIWVIGYPDPLDGFVSCDEATLVQRVFYGAYIPTSPQN